MRNDYMQQAENFELIVDGIRINAIVAGEGPTLVFVHGGPGLSLDYFLPYVLPLAKSFTLVLYDQIGCGKSEKLANPHDYRMANEVMVLDALREWSRKNNPKKQFFLFGHSFGAVVCMSYLKEHPFGADKVILNCASPIHKVREIDPLLGRLSRMRKDLKSELIQMTRLRKKRPWTIQEQTRAVALGLSGGLVNPDQISELNFVYSPDVADAISKEMVAYDLREHMQKVVVPVLVLASRYDFFVIEAQEITKNAFPNSKLVVLEKSGHFPFLEEPEKFRKEVQNFFEVTVVGFIQ